MSTTTSSTAIQQISSFFITATLALLFASCGRNDLEVRSYDVAKTAAGANSGGHTDAEMMKQAADAPAADSRPPNTRASAPGSEPNSASVPSGDAVVPPSAASSGDVKWDAPSGWVAGVASAMRVASFTTPGKGDASIVVLGGDAGGLVANVNRWRGQIGLQAASEEVIQASAKSASGPHGKFQWFKLLGVDNGGNSILAAIVAKPGKSIFVKLTGPGPVLTANQEKFLNLCKSIRVAAEQ